jgi:hypothetical protein
MTGTLTADGLTLSAGESVTLGSTTLTESTDLIINNDVELQDATPHLRLTDTTASEDDFELYAENNKFILANVTDGLELFLVDANNAVRFPRLTSCDTIDTDANGKLQCGTDETGAPGGGITGLTADSGGATTGTAVTLTGGTGIDTTRSSDTVTFDLDTTEIEATTWGAGGNASNIWTFNLSGTDHTMTAGSGLMTFSNGVTVSGTASAANVAVTGTGGTGYLTMVGQASNPSSPAAGTLLLNATTSNGFTRLEQDNESTANTILGRDSMVLVKNTSGGAIAVGNVVYITGATGSVPNIAKAKADSAATLPAMYVAANAIADNAFGMVMRNGIISGFDTSGFSVGSPVWVSTTTAGALTATRPSGTTNFVQRIGTILVSNVATGALDVAVAPAVLNQETGTNAATWTGLDITVSGGNINTGNIALVVGDATTDTITLTTDGTGDGEVVLPDDSIGDDEIDWSGLTTSANFTVTGSLIADGVTLSASESVTLGSTTLTESTDLIINNDVELQDATPHLRLTDTTGSEDDYEIYADASKLIISNVTDGIEVFTVQNSQVSKIRQLTTRSFTIENLAAADDNVPIPGVNEHGVVKALWCTCHGTCTTPATITLENSAGNAMTGTATCSTAPTIPDVTTITAGGTFGQRQDLRFDVTNAISPETDEYTISFEYLPD